MILFSLNTRTEVSVYCLMESDSPPLLSSLSPIMPSDKKIGKLCKEFIAPYQITDGKGFRLSKKDPRDTGIFSKKHKQELIQQLENGVRYLEILQDKLYAEKKQSLLIILQAMDAAGKDSIIKHVMGGINPQGCLVTSFKQPSVEEKSHDFLWRCAKALPERGMIGIFNRSYYEEVLTLKIHPEWLANEGINPKSANEKFWNSRYESIRNFERHLVHNNTKIIKIFLHLSKEEQAKRFLSRLDMQSKNWKFSANDMKERSYWDQYQQVFQDMICKTSTEEAPWYVVPADNKWFSRIVVLASIVEQMTSLKLNYPEVSPEQEASFPEIKRQLEKELKAEKHGK